MNVRDWARADQIVALLRESPEPLTITEIHERLGNPGLNGWSGAADWTLVNELKTLGVLEFRPGCCTTHSLWALPEDR